MYLFIRMTEAFLQSCYITQNTELKIFFTNLETRYVGSLYVSCGILCPENPEVAQAPGQHPEWPLRHSAGFRYPASCTAWALNQTILRSKDKFTRCHLLRSHGSIMGEISTVLCDTIKSQKSYKT